MCLLCACILKVCRCARVFLQSVSMQQKLERECGIFFFFSSSSRSVESVTKKDLRWTDDHSTGNWNCTKRNHFSTKAERMPLVTNATDSSVCVCLCIVNVCVCVCVTVIWRANRERASNTRSHSGSPQKSHLTMYCCNTRICTNVKSWKQLSIWLLVILDLVFRPVELYSLA